LSGNNGMVNSSADGRFELLLLVLMVDWAKQSRP